MENIHSIEKQLIGILTNDKKSWVEMYRLMEVVEKEKMYEQEDYPSFTSWVNALADKAKVHVSLLWKRKKAGKYYEEYREAAIQRGIEIPKIEEISVSPDNLELVEKIAGGNEKVADQLMEKVISHDLGRTDLKKAWETVKSERKNKGIIVTRKTKHDKDKIEEKLNNDKVAEEVITAANIVYSLSKSSEWLGDARSDYNNKYKVLTEVAVRTGTSRNARRIDAMVLETITVDHPDELVLRGIEIKVSKEDLLNDTKMAEYVDFVDYFYIAIPVELLEYAEQVRMPDWGILIIGMDGSVIVKKEAKKQKAIMREKTLAQACYNII